MKNNPPEVEFRALELDEFPEPEKNNRWMIAIFASVAIILVLVVVVQLI